MAYYVNIFADRDMFMRYTGLGAGHHAQYHPPTMETCEDGANDVGDPSDTLDDEDSSELGDGETKDVQSVSMDEGLEDGSDDAEGPEDSEDEMDSSSESEEEEEEEEEEEDSDGDSVFEF
ncbi:hypothetical protein L210DRAFT_3525186 [Boletus edulis BED1]|uniref:Uncharacterized protein n=1 Tax=Boletus edulis BED1 TaxID=1328754 RepID=A0AAD4C3A7_BOLED|nr:hypothetical protein L210DRAFT_3525186 [Boletus edulis BED1]